AAHHVDSFSRNGLASGELDRWVVLRAFLLDAPPQIEGCPKRALGGQLSANFIPVTVENVVFSDGPHSQGRGLLQTGGCETLCDDQALGRRVLTIAESGNWNVDPVLGEGDLLRSHILGNAPKSMPRKDDEGRVIPGLDRFGRGKARGKKHQHQETEQTKPHQITISQREDGLRKVSNYFVL